MRFHVKAIHPHQGFVQFTIDAVDSVVARQQCQAQGYAVLGVKPSAFDWTALTKRGGAIALPIFVQQLVFLLSAGLSLVEALETLTERENPGEQRRTLQSVLGNVKTGQPLSAALAQAGDTFPPLFIATIRASEHTGDVVEALQRYLHYLNQVALVRQRIIGALIYPSLLFAAAGMVALFLLVFVIPRFGALYADMHADLPFFSRMFLALGGLMHDHQGAMFVVLVAIFGGAGVWLSQKQHRAQMMYKLFSLPVLRNYARLYEVARLYRTNAMLLRSGVPLVEALNMSLAVLSPQHQTKLRAGIVSVSEGVPLSNALEQQQLSTPVARRLIVTGERSGQLAKMLENAAQFHEDEMARWIEFGSRFLEPLVMVFVGLIIGVIVVLMYIPIFDMASNIP